MTKLDSSPAAAREADAADKLFIGADSLLRDSFVLGQRIVDDGFRPSFLVGVWRGGAPIGIAVQELLEYRGIHADHIAIRTSSYAPGIDRPEKTVRVHAIDYLVSRLNADDRRRNMPAQLRIATVYYKPARNRSRLQPDYYVHATDRWLVFPHELQGLTPKELQRHKPLPPGF